MGIGETLGDRIGAARPRGNSTEVAALSRIKGLTSKRRRADTDRSAGPGIGERAGLVLSTRREPQWCRCPYSPREKPPRGVTELVWGARSSPQGARLRPGTQLAWLADVLGAIATWRKSRRLDLLWVKW
jgi:hypothetical protein